LKPVELMLGIVSVW